MKNSAFTLENFETETISKQQQQAIKGGGNDSQTPPPTDTNNPVKGTGGNGNG
ncbi:MULTISPECIES: rSAM-modified peptide [unclassified Flavobacterium]|jgi:hypothetical protein|uniref:rSAM-modified peptide n=1 Tax=unclassified Flavobacterium TaxID=196869 RepID=UPI000AC641F8|nr:MULTISPECIES: rSAM-modified peptide [unclassified Flavobacterium]MDQ1163830.1 hypothetical protein [Flavobacterium sp. SORGH_AS_0622]TDX13752.1 hypothetical protein EDB96_0459 [Flavobacterium sp. S87F.05.LMB.W.Kidney.N]BDU24403.1 hypothetical protein FLGSB24_11470 [Flavobacterium sp. GSB-24]